MPLRWPDFQPDLDELRAAVSDRARVILVNDPHNPTGAVFSRELQDEVIPLAERHDAVIATGLRLPDAFFQSIAQTLRDKRDLLGSGLRAAGFEVSVAAGSYFTVADAAPLGATDAAEFCRALPDRAGVVAIPLTAFVGASRRAEYATLVRFAACKRVSVLEEAASRLAAHNS